MTGFGPDRRAFLRTLGGLCLTAVAGGGMSGSGTARAWNDRGVRVEVEGAAKDASRALDPDHTEVARAFRTMGTILEVRIQGIAREDAIVAIARLRGRMEELEAALTLFRPEAPLARLAKSREGRWIDAPRDLLDALTLTGDAVDRTGGGFDPTVAPMMRAWGLYGPTFEEPGRAVVRAWRDRPGWTAVEVDERAGRVRRRDARVEVDLGGIGKGIALDAAVSLLRQSGVEHGLVNFGGSLAVIGPPIDGSEGWPVGIAHPRKDGAVWSVVELRSGFLSTSADSERFHLGPDGVRRHHILDPRTGAPVGRVASVTVWSDRATDGDVASTAVFVHAGRGEESGPDSPLVAAAALLPRPRLLLLEDQGADLREVAVGWERLLG